MNEPLIQFTVEGHPKTAGSKVARPIMTKKPLISKRGLYYGNSTMKDSCDNKAWIAAVEAAANKNWADGWLSPLDGPLILGLKFWLPRPKADYGTGRNAGILKKSAPKHHIKKPDLTKLIRCAEDALTGILWNDDSQVVEHRATKECVPTFTTPPGVWISVWRAEG